MLTFASLTKIGSGWAFASEAALEDFVWEHLQSLLGFTPLKRQYAVKGQYCDILAIDKNQRLVVLELKNTEDRYIVQQLTRYYDALLEEKPFADLVDYSQPICLMAIAPSFHRDNWTDKKYTKLSIFFWEFSIDFDQNSLILLLHNLDKIDLFKFSFEILLPQSTNNIPTPPNLLLNVLHSYDSSKQTRIFQVRDSILKFDSRMQEFVSANSIKYGIKKGKDYHICAEFYFHNKTEIILFLYLPIKDLTSKIVKRARLWTNWDELALVEGYVQQGVGGKITLRKRSIAQFIQKIKQGRGSNSYLKKYIDECSLIRRKVRELQPILHEEIELFNVHYELRGGYNKLDQLIEVALTTWSNRL